ncbi:hypothetical protein J0H58_18370 [bacterium]|nr:hypothetical protein [bacterium]
MVLCELGGVSRRDTAGRLGVPEGTVSSRLAKGRKLLTDRLRRRGVVALGLAALAPAVVPPRLVAAAFALASGEPASARVAALAHGVVLHKFRAVSVALGLVAAVVLAAGPSAGRSDIPRRAPSPPPLLVAAQPPAPKAPPVGIVVGQFGAYWRFDAGGKKVGEFSAPSGLRYAGLSGVFSPDGTRVALVGQKDDPPRVSGPELGRPWPLRLVVVPVAGGEEPKVYDFPGHALEAHWMPDGKSVVVAQASSDDLAIYHHQRVDLATGKTHPFALGASDRLLDVMPDRKSLLVEQRRGAGKGTVLARTEEHGDGGVVLTALAAPRGSVVARFSPDGKRVRFTDGDPARKDAHRQGRSHRPYVLDLATKAREPLADVPENGQAVGVCWAPDGKRVAYTWAQLHADLLAKDVITADESERDTEGVLIVADSDGRNARTVASDISRSVGHPVIGALDWR